MSVENLYLLILFLVLPLYAPSGYVGLGDAKSRLYIVCSVPFAIYFAICGLIRLIKRIQQKRESSSCDTIKEVSFWRFVVFLLILSLWISSALSGYFADAWSGADGWMMGLLVQSLSLGFALVYSVPPCSCKSNRKRHAREYMYVGGAITILLGIVNRFRFFPLSYMGIDYTYLSTIGNIDWFCGYLSVIVPFAMGDLYISRVRMLEEKHTNSGKTQGKETWKFLALEFFTALSFLLLILLGTESSYLILGICFFTMATISINSRAGCIAFLEQGMLFGILPVILHWLLSSNVLVLDFYLSENSQGISWKLLQKWYGYALALATIAFLVWLYDMKKLSACSWNSVLSGGGRRNPESESIKTNSGFRRNVVRSWTTSEILSYRALLHLIEALCIVGMLALLFLQVILPNWYSDAFGSYRGLIWKTCGQIFRKLPFQQKLFGIGPDCVYRYLVDHPDYRSILLDRFGMDIMNAHSVLLNRLLTTGLVGTILFLILIIVALKILNRQRRFLPYVLMLLSYSAVGTVLFEQILCLPYMLLLLGIGIGESCEPRFN